MLEGMKKDLNQSVYSIVQQATGETQKVLVPKVKNSAAVELGKLGGLKGGNARAIKLTAEKRKEIAVNAAKARWGTPTPNPTEVL
jgi:hypothetical protein